MKNLLYDVETLATHEDAVLLQFTALMYNGDGNEETAEQFIENCAIFDVKLDVTDQAKLGRKIDRDTVDWWQSQPSAVQAEVLIPSKNDVPLEVAMTSFECWLKDQKFNKKTDTIWQRGDRDTAWLISAFMTAGWIPASLPLAWYRVRDLRTAVDVMGASSKLNGYPDNVAELQAMIPGFQKHNSKYDIILEAFILRQLGVL